MQPPPLFDALLPFAAATASGLVTGAGGPAGPGAILSIGLFLTVLVVRKIPIDQLLTAQQYSLAPPVPPG
jgi:hypothetical protein